MRAIATDPSADGVVVLDHEGFAAAVRPFWTDMGRLARALAPQGQWEDVLQDSLALAWRRRDSFDESRGTVRTWLLMIVADQARKSLRRLRTHAELVDLPSGTDPTDEDLDLAHALAQLSARQRTAVALYYYAGMPVADIAVALRCSTGTIKSTLADARKRLRRDLGEDYRHA